MILQALKDYYDRFAADPDSDIAPEGFEKKPLEFLVVIDNAGELINIEDTREKLGKKTVAKSFILPRSKGRCGSKSYATTFLLWDHIGYLFGYPKDDKKSANQHQTWIDSLEKLPQDLKSDVGVQAIIRFYSNGGIDKVANHPMFQECLKSVPCNMSFRLQEDLMPVPCRKKISDYVADTCSVNDEDETDSQNSLVTGYCIATGELGEIARTHGRTPINKDTKSLIGFQKNSGYDSYGKEQGYNAPVIKSTEFAYVTGLNTLLKSRNQRLNIGDTATVFWSAKKTDFETNFSSFFSEPPKDDPEISTRAVRALFAALKTGVYHAADKDTDFYILGLSPNSARISVRFWHNGRIGEFATKIKQHFDDLQIVKSPKEPEFYSLWRLLVNVASQDKSENIPPNLAGEFMRAILSGIPYPATLLQAALRRIHSDTDSRVKPVRAALIKAYLNRYHRVYDKSKHKELTMGLDINQPSAGYQLGRLFAVLAKIQDEAQPGINATIRERFYGAACASPVTVFANLLKLKQHHLAKLPNKGRVVTFERLLGEIMGHLNDFPAYLDLHEQGRFAIGYYHQWQDFFTKTTTAETGNQEKTMEAGE